MSASEFNEIIAFHKLAPIDHSRADINAALIAATIANVNRGKRRKPFKIADFIPFSPPEPEPDEKSAAEEFFGVKL